jgi:hypothetical protein
LDAANGTLIDLGGYVSRAKPERVTATDRGIDLATIQPRNVDLKSARGIFGQPDFIRRRTSCHIYGVRLAHHGYDSTWTRPYTITIIGAARCINIKTSEDLGRRAVEPKDNLNAAIWILC